MSSSSYPPLTRRVKTNVVKTNTVKTSSVRSCGTRRLYRDLQEKMDQQHHEREERWQAIRLGRLATPHSHWVIARLNEIQHLGALDRKHGIGHVYEGPVGTDAAAERMHAQISEHRGDVAVTFWPRDGRARRLLVTARGEAYVEAWTKEGPTAIRHTGKYLAAFGKIAPIRVTNSAVTNLRVTNLRVTNTQEVK